MTNYEECNRAGAKASLLMARQERMHHRLGARSSPRTAYGDALRFAELCDAVLITSRNVVREKYQLGRERRPYEG